MSNASQDNEIDSTIFKKRRTRFFWIGVVTLFALIPLWVMRGLLILNHKNYERVGDLDIVSEGIDLSSVRLNVRLLGTSHVWNILGLVEYDRAGEPFRPVIYIRSGTKSPYEVVEIKQLTICYADGTTRDTLAAGGELRYELKDPDAIRDPRKYTLGGRPEDLKPFYSFHEYVPVNLALDWGNNKTCTVRVDGVLVDAMGKQTPFAISAEYERSKIFRIGLKAIAQMSG